MKKIAIWFGSTIVVILIALGFLRWWLMPTPPEFDAAHHPFVSAEAKTEFLALYQEWENNWPIETTRQFIDTSFGATYVHLSGPKNAPPLILLHGGRSNGLMWRPNVEGLSEHFRVVAVDIMNDNGRSVPTKEILSAKDYADWLNDITTSLFPEQRVNLMGVSYGGWISSEFALRYPHKLNKLILLAPAGIGSGFSFSRVVDLSKVIIDSGSFKGAIDWAIQDTLQSTPENRQFAEQFIALTLLGFEAFKSRKMVFPKPMSSEQLNSISVPILYMVGENEKMYSATETLTHLANTSPQIDTELIRGAGHDLTVVKAEQINQYTYDFIISEE